jgi:exodeoxyribonuclease V alpha subunit
MSVNNITREPDILEGTISKILVQKPHFTVFKVSTQSHDSNFEFTVKTNKEELGENDHIKAIGYFSHHLKYGTQFNASEIEILNRSDKGLAQRKKEKITNILLDFPGVGPKTAQKIVDDLGYEFIENILNNGENESVLSEINHIKNKKYTNIIESLLKNSRDSRYKNSISYLNNRLLLSLKDSQKIWDGFFGDPSLKPEDFSSMLNNDPYILSPILPFEQTDKIAQKIFNIEPTDNRRIDSSITEAVRMESTNRGNCYTQIKKCVRAADKLLNKDDYNTIPSSDIEDRLYQLASINESEIIVPKNPVTKLFSQLVYLKKVYFAEINIAKKIKAKLSNKNNIPDNLEQIIKDYEHTYNIALETEQKNAIKNAWLNDLWILTGPPGTGKTETIRMYLHTIKKITPDASIILLAPTANAANILREVTGEINTMTIHRAIKAYKNQSSPGLHYKKDIMDYDIVIIDEMSMVDAELFGALMTSLQPNARLLLVGDPDQLPSVGPGTILRDLVEKIPCTRLQKIHRQIEDSSIPYICRDVINGSMPNFNNDDTLFIKINHPDKIKELIVKMVEKYKDVGGQVITPRRQGAELSADDLNMVLQEHFNAENQSDDRFWLKDKVIQIQNRYDLGVINGDIGYVVDKSDEGDLVVNFPDAGLDITYSPGVIDDNLDLAYTLTAHKSQGSSFQIAIVPLIMDFGRMLDRQVIYTAFSRPRKKLIVIGEVEALLTAIQNNSSVKRKTSLQKRLEEKAVDSREI